MKGGSSSVQLISATAVVPEKKRTYHFPGGNVASFENVVRIEIRDSGKHRIETAEGRKAFVCPGWHRLEIETDAWTW